MLPGGSPFLTNPVVQKVSDMARINTKIANLEAILENPDTLGRTRTDSEAAKLETELHRLSYIQGLWDEFGTVPMDPETECIEREWNGFPAGTFREDIWYWFEETFNISVAEDLMYGAAKEG